MTDPQSTVLLCAVEREVRVEAKARGLRPARGGTPGWWSTIGKVMDRLAQEETDPDGNRWRNRFQRYRKRVGEEQVAKDADSVDPRRYRPIVEMVLEGKEIPPGEASPKEKDPKEPKEPKEKPKKKRQPTAEELDALTAEDILGLADMDIKIEKAQAKARLYERLYEAAKKRASFVEAACDALRDTVVAMPPAEWDPKAVPVVHMRREQDAVLVLSDIHVGDAIHPDTMGALNVYNYDIFCQKAKRLYAGVRESLEMFREWGSIRKLWVLGLGDWVTGTNIFPGQAHHIQIGAMKQAMSGAEEMARVLYEFQALPGIEHIQLESVPGNHGRPGKKGQDPPEDNWDLVLYEFMKLRLASQKHMTVNWHESWWMMPRIRGWDFLCAHGDEVRAWGGIPNYGFRRWAAKWREMLDSVGKRYDYGLIGHHHYEVEEGNLIISGAWPGASFFSAKFLQSGGAATQMFYSVAEDYGITWRRRLPLDPPKRGEGAVNGSGAQPLESPSTGSHD